MAVSITQRPALWVPILNPVIYKFTTTGGPFTNYRISIEVFRSSDNTSITGGVKFNFSPNPSGITTVDIGTFLRNYLRKEYEPVTVGNNKSEGGIGSEKFYIKYQELYTGSATSVVSDSANPSIGVLSGLQIGAASADLDAYVPEDSTKKFLTDLNKLWTGYPFTISFLYQLSLIINNYVLPDPSVWSDGPDAFGTKNATHFIKNSMAGGVSYVASSGPSVPIPIGHKPRFTCHINATVAVGDTITIQIIITNSGVLAFDFVNITSTSSLDYDFNNFAVISGSTGTTIFINASSMLAGSSVDIEIVPSGSLTSSIASSSGIDKAKLTEYDTLNNVIATTDLALDLYAQESLNRLLIPTLDTDTNKIEVFLTNVTDVPFTETKTIYVHKPCKNPVYLFWKNKLGGDCFWMFDYSQEYTFTYSDGRKAKRATLFANNVTADEWEELNDINTPGFVFTPNIQELTTSVNKTSVKSDQQAYIVFPDASKIGVIVIPKTNTFVSGNRRTTFEIEIEYPELYL